jgi:hypothetical protein
VEAAAADRAHADDLRGTFAEGEPVSLICVDFPFLKARPAQDGDRRYIYCEASNEVRDQEGEVVKQSALRGSKDFFLSNGNVDIEHKSILPTAVTGVENPREWEIGRPVDVRFGDTETFCKSEIYQRNPKSEWFWGTIAVQDPPMQWFPSVGGIPLARETKVDPHTGEARVIITKAKWFNLAFAREPQNLAVSPAKIVPIGAFLKALAFASGARCCLGPDCSPESTCKAITAGYGTDSATLTGGAALRRQSIQGGVLHLWDQHLAKYVRALGTDACPHSRAPQTIDTLHNHFSTCAGLAPADAAAATTRLLRMQARRRARRGGRHE